MHPASLRPDPHASTHSLILGYVLWVFGFMGLHRFYYGKPVTGTLWLFTFGLLGVGWLVDVLLIPRMNRQADLRYRAGPIHYSLAWVLLLLGGWLGLHRMYLGKWVTGVIYLLTLGLLGLGVLYDFWTLNTQITLRHAQQLGQRGFGG